MCILKREKLRCYLTHLRKKNPLVTMWFQSFLQCKFKKRKIYNLATQENEEQSGLI